MRVLHLALITALLAPGVAAAQSPAAQQMLESARRMRASAEQLKGKLPDKDLAQMVRQAEEIEQQVRDGVYDGVAAPKQEPTNAERIMAAHGRLMWLEKEAACAGYTLENYSTFRFSSAINERDTHCRNAYGHWATYLRYSRGGDQEGAEQALFYYDAAARRAVGFYGRR